MFVVGPEAVCVQRSPAPARSLRYLLVDGGIHTIVDLETGEARHPYAEVMELLPHFFERPGDMLLVGLGGGRASSRSRTRSSISW